MLVSNDMVCLLMQGEPQDSYSNRGLPVKLLQKVGAQHLRISFISYHFKFARYISDLNLVCVCVCVCIYIYDLNLIVYVYVIGMNRML